MKCQENHKNHEIQPKLSVTLNGTLLELYDLVSFFNKVHGGNEMSMNGEERIHYFRKKTPKIITRSRR